MGLPTAHSRYNVKDPSGVRLVEQEWDAGILIGQQVCELKAKTRPKILPKTEEAGYMKVRDKGRDGRMQVPQVSPALRVPAMADEGLRPGEVSLSAALTGGAFFGYVPTCPSWAL